MKRVLAFLIGWDWHILKNCTYASMRQLTKYGSALLLIMALWCVIGFNFADRYFGADTLGSIFTACGFAIIIWLVERVIILSGKNALIVIIRVVLALCMSVLGATIIDQIIFKKDIEQGKIEYITDKVNEELSESLNLIKLKEKEIQYEIDSLTIVNSQLQEEVNRRPMIRIVNYTERQVGEADSLGRIEKERFHSTQHIPNPKNEDLKNNQERLNSLRQQKDNLFNESQNVEQNLRKQFEENFGLLKELDVVFKILLKGWTSIVLYVILFLFFLLIELLIVFTKYADKQKCDYEELIERQNYIRISEIKNTLS